MDDAPENLPDDDRGPAPTDRRSRGSHTAGGVTVADLFAKITGDIPQELRRRARDDDESHAQPAEPWPGEVEGGVGEVDEVDPPTVPTPSAYAFEVGSAVATAMGSAVATAMGSQVASQVASEIPDLDTINDFPADFPGDVPGGATASGGADPEDPEAPPPILLPEPTRPRLNPYPVLRRKQTPSPLTSPPL
ncbi:hypothetical protein, partial [Mycolicibacterium palauense]|uniref:hypothetical protein n=1 Tax=Mycolicibacterium palauense TaxID=2034511 RepID=UPI001145CFB9